ncbi:UDP-N-acetylmuramate--L-alanine ligase [Tistrella mobilis]|uniref:UDP-N-acetylmuramate--L-alanine ligase n=1 Tax=Tistrella mobilis TaxID=171437 RepID=UPI003557008A
MRRIPLTIGTLHFVGIGGIGMSGIAEILQGLGYDVQGSDIAENANVRRLRAKGVRVAIGHVADNIANAAVVVVSSAIRQDNPELVEARRRFLPVVRRAEMLAELMRLRSAVAVGGTHGKTTTTSLVAAVLDAGDIDPTVINGGIINAYGTNARPGEGEWMVVEADESDGSFLKLPATIAIVTNIDPEHLDHYRSFAAVREAFRTFVENIPFYGLAVLCSDHAEVQALIGQVQDRRIVTYGFNPQADIRAVDVRHDVDGARFTAVIRDRRAGSERRITDLHLAMHGPHNVQNALSAIAVADELGIPDDAVRKALAGFAGVKRRFTVTGEANGVRVIDDYGHHPVEIAAVLRAARGVAQDHRVVAVVQPHRYSRLMSLFEEFCTCFNDADTVVVADVYAAGETPIEGIDRDALVEGLRARGHRHVVALDGPETLAAVVKPLVSHGDMIVCLGAGNITAWAEKLPRELAALEEEDGA